MRKLEYLTNRELIDRIEGACDSIWEENKIPRYLIAMTHDYESYFCGKMPHPLYKTDLGAKTAVDAFCGNFKLAPSYQKNKEAKAIFESIVEREPSPGLKRCIWMHCIQEGQISAQDYLDQLKELPPSDFSNIGWIINYSLSICVVTPAHSDIEMEDAYREQSETEINS